MLHKTSDRLVTKSIGILIYQPKVKNESTHSQTNSRFLIPIMTVESFSIEHTNEAQCPGDSETRNLSLSFLLFTDADKTEWHGAFNRPTVQVKYGMVLQLFDLTTTPSQSQSTSKRKFVFSLVQYFSRYPSTKRIVG